MKNLWKNINKLRWNDKKRKLLMFMIKMEGQFREAILEIWWSIIGRLFINKTTIEWKKCGMQIHLTPIATYR